MTSIAVLYVEDSPTDILLMQRALANAGVENLFSVVQGAQPAIDYLSGAGPYADREKYPLPHLVLLDLNLPDKPGFEVLKWIRRNPLFKTLAVLVYSSSAQSQDIQTAYDLGANAYVVKPANFEKFVEVFRAIRDFWLVNNQPPQD